MNELSVKVISSENRKGLLQFSKISINEEYRRKWNIHENDFICLTINGELVRNTLYRVGGMNNINLNTDEYILLLKHVEAFYSEDITDITDSDPKHLESRWCILDKNGNEKVEFKAYKTPYLIKDSCVYSIDYNYFNIETGECYGYSSTSMRSKEFIFLDNRFDKDKSKRGVIKINKKDGSSELFQSE